jgi:signal transduction histidine kinase
MATAGSADSDERLRTLVHALRTPLTIVEGFADALGKRGEEMSREERAEYVERIGDAAREMRELLDDSGR